MVYFGFVKDKFDEVVNWKVKYLYLELNVKWSWILRKIRPFYVLESFTVKGDREMTKI